MDTNGVKSRVAVDTRRESEFPYTVKETERTALELRLVPEVGHPKHSCVLSGFQPRFALVGVDRLVVGNTVTNVWVAVHVVIDDQYSIRAIIQKLKITLSGFIRDIETVPAFNTAPRHRLRNRFARYIDLASREFVRPDPAVIRPDRLVTSKRVLCHKTIVGHPEAFHPLKGKAFIMFRLLSCGRLRRRGRDRPFPTCGFGLPLKFLHEGKMLGQSFFLFLLATCLVR